MPDQNIYRLIDANVNRAKEGLRVGEDICRYVLDHEDYSASYKQLRHQLTHVLQDLSFLEMIAARDIEQDVGRATTASESKRITVLDVYCANAQRVKESLRVLEESTKLIRIDVADAIKKIRYEFYRIEQAVVLYLNNQESYVK